MCYLPVVLKICQFIAFFDVFWNSKLRAQGLICSDDDLTIPQSLCEAVMIRMTYVFRSDVHQGGKLIPSMMYMNGK